MSSESEECCGNGCNNCVLDKKSTAQNVNLMDNIFEHQYKWFTVTDIQQETNNVFILEFQIHDENSKCLFVPSGAHLMLRIPMDYITRDTNTVFEGVRTGRIVRSDQEMPPVRPSNDPETKTGEFVSRPYSPFEYSTEALSFKIIFRYEDGEMSQRMIKLQIGDLVEWKGCYGDLNYSRNLTKNLICICQGVAIAPMVNVVQNILNDDQDETRIHLIGCFKDFPDILLKKTLRGFQNFWNFKLTLFLPHHNHGKESSICDCAKNRKMYTEDIFFERITKQSLENLQLPSESFYLISGSEAFIKTTCELVKTHFCTNEGNIFAL